MILTAVEDPLAKNQAIDMMYIASQDWVYCLWTVPLLSLTVTQQGYIIIITGVCSFSAQPNGPIKTCVY